MPETRLLVIEDDPDIADLLLAYFGLLQEYILFHAADGQEGIALARTQHPTLILLDVMLPDMTGWQVAEALRTTALTRYIPIIFLSQLSQRHDRLHGLELGADDYVTKPFDMEELRLRIQAVLRRSMQARLYEPRTGLPGAPLIAEELTRLTGKSGWDQLGFTIDHLGAFRETYGFMAADEALGAAAQIILDVLNELGTPDDFAGITDDDRLIVITHSGQSVALARAVRDRFDARSKLLYNFRDVERGHIVLFPGTAQEKRVPLMRLTVGAQDAGADAQIAGV